MFAEAGARIIAWGVTDQICSSRRACGTSSLGTRPATQLSWSSLTLPQVLVSRIPAKCGYAMAHIISPSLLHYPQIHARPRLFPCSQLNTMRYLISTYLVSLAMCAFVTAMPAGDAALVSRATGNSKSFDSLSRGISTQLDYSPALDNTSRLSALASGRRNRPTRPNPPVIVNGGSTRSANAGDANGASTNTTSSGNLTNPPSGQNGGTSSSAGATGRNAGTRT